MSKDKTHYNLGKFSVTLSDYFVKPALVKQFIDDDRKPQVEKELRTLLEKALSNTDRKFAEKRENAVVANALCDLSASDWSNIRQAVRDFYDRPNTSGLALVLEKQLAEEITSGHRQQITDAVAEFIHILRRELVNINLEACDTIVAHTLLEIAMRLSVVPMAPDGPDLPMSMLPPLPDFYTFTGREEALADLRARIGVDGDYGVQRLTIMRGWPGVGKTTLSTVLAYQTDVKRTFPDGILWTSLGDEPDLMSTMRGWGHTLGVGDIVATSRNLNEAIGHLRTTLNKKKILIIVDDVYELEHGKLLRDIGGPQCLTLFTTRFMDVASDLAEVPGRDIYKLDQLAPEHALELLRRLVPETTDQYPTESRALVTDLEGLPLAIQVAGRMLYKEKMAGLNVSALLKDLRETTMIMEEVPPASRVGLAKETSLTIAALFMKSTDRLTDKNREYFAFLGALAPKPANFDIEDMKVGWQVDDPTPIVRDLVDRGLLEYDCLNDRYQMHALLTMHARYLLGS